MPHSPLNFSPASLLFIPIFSSSLCLTHFLSFLLVFEGTTSGIFNIAAFLSSDPVSITIAGHPDLTSTISCSSASVKADEIIQCTVIPRKSNQTIWAIADDITPSLPPRGGSFGSPSPSTDLGPAQLFNLSYRAGLSSGTYQVGLNLSSHPFVLTVTCPAFLGNIQTVTAASGYYRAGETIFIQVHYSHAVDIVGNASLKLNVQSGLSASLVNGSGSNILTFQYIVQDGDNVHLSYNNSSSLVVTGSISVSQSDCACSIVLPDPASNSSLAGSSQVWLDTTPPSVTRVVGSPSSGYWTVGDTVNIVVVFSDVVVGNTVGLQLNLGIANRTALYSAGNYSSAITFSYVVQSGDTSLHLCYSDDHALILLSNSSFISDRAGNLAILQLPSVYSNTSLFGTSNVVIDTQPPSLLFVTAVNGSYHMGSLVSISIYFSEQIMVQGVPVLQLSTGNALGSGSAFYVSACGTSASCLLFQYTVRAGDTTSALSYVGTSSLLYPTSQALITDLAGNNATLTLPPLTSSFSLGQSSRVILDTTPPTVLSVTSSHSSGIFKAGAQIMIFVTFSEPIIVTGNPTLQLWTRPSGFSGQNTTVDFHSLNGSVLSFLYVVAVPDTSDDLTYTGTSALTVKYVDIFYHRLGWKSCSVGSSRFLVSKLTRWVMFYHYRHNFSCGPSS